MANNPDWINLSTPLLLLIGQKLGSCEDFIRFSAVCKSWQSVFPEMREGKKPLLLSPESPLLMLAEEVPEGSLPISCDIDVLEDGLVEDTDEEEYEDVDQEELDDGGMEENEEDHQEEDDGGMEENEEDHQEESEDEDDGGMDENEEDHQEEDDGDMEENEEDHQEEDDGDMEENDEDHQEESDEKNEDADMEEGQELQQQEGGVVADMEGGMEEYGGLSENGDENMQEREEDRKYTVGGTRTFYRLSSGKMYTIELPEAAGKLILGTNKGWVITLGEDFQANLLHPVLREQILLPSMSTFRVGNEDCPHNEEFDVFIRKVVMSPTPNPIIMTIYGKHGNLGFAKLGDRVWTKVDISTCGFVDIAYHLGYFLAVDCRGDTYVFDVNESTRGETAGVIVASCPPLAAAASDFSEKYLVESGGTLWLLVRFRRVKIFKPPHHKIVKYRTIGFLVWKMKNYRSEDGNAITATWKSSHDLGNQAFFVGRNSSASLPPSGHIRPNCIYFTDDAWDLYYGGGGGHDVGVFDVVSSTMAQQYRGQKNHLISPPFWYI